MIIIYQHNDYVGAKHSEDYFSGNPEYLYPNASPWDMAVREKYFDWDFGLGFYHNLSLCLGTRAKHLDCHLWVFIISYPFVWESGRSIWIVIFGFLS